MQDEHPRSLFSSCVLHFPTLWLVVLIWFRLLIRRYQAALSSDSESPMSTFWSHRSNRRTAQEWTNRTQAVHERTSVHFLVLPGRWCDRWLLITKRPKAPSHYRYLKLGPLLHPLGGIEWCSVLRLLVFLCILRFRIFEIRVLNASRSCFKFNQLFPFYLGGVWCIVMNNHPIKCLCIYNLQIIYISYSKSFFLVSCLYVVSVEILNNSKFSRARGS